LLLSLGIEAEALL